MNTFVKYILFVSICTFLVSPTIVVALIPEGELETLELKITTELDEIVTELITEKQICEELWCPWPIQPTRKSIAEVSKDIDYLVKKESAKEFIFRTERKFLC